ncbi:MAG TPA: hypothetical protein VFZ02_12620 [Ktedonobacteraceae bacterium]
MAKQGRATRMSTLTAFGACAVAIMLLSYALEQRSSWWVLIFALACAASSLYGWLAGTWPFGVVEGVWALVAFRRWWLVRLSQRREQTLP